MKHYYLDNIDNVTARYRHLREEAAYPGSVCPSREGGLELVRLVLAQVMEVHSASTHIHIGCDEVRYTVYSRSAAKLRHFPRNCCKLTPSP